ncbi:MAG: response regulator [Polyangiaceae bacterium]|jgi:DNA-binding NtrC family response regulator|nr:response regulator [Polyangiaceae bacterium]
MNRAIKLLIVDDESRFLAAIAARLRFRGFDVRTASNGMEAIALARAERFHLALIDLRMPGLDGGQVLEILKQEHPHLEAIILTGHGALESSVELSKAGAFTCLPKPYELEKLILALQQAYVVRLRKKYARNADAVERITASANGDDPLKVLARLSAFEDDA